MSDLKSRSSVSTRLSLRRGQLDPRHHRNGRKQQMDLGARLGNALRVDGEGRLEVAKIQNIDPADPEFATKLVAALIAGGLMEN